MIGLEALSQDLLLRLVVEALGAFLLASLLFGAFILFEIRGRCRLLEVFLIFSVSGIRRRFMLVLMTTMALVI